MQKSLLYFLFIILFPVSVQAQSNFKKGYVVTMPGDTLNGYIDFREWNQSPKSFAFKSAPDAPTTQQLTPANTRYVNIQGLEIYQQYKGRVSQDKVVLPKIATGIDTSTISDAIFLKVLQTGKNVSLYSYRDLIKTRFFLQRHDQDVPQELIYRIYYKVQDEKEQSSRPDFTIQSKLYIGQLWFAAGKYQAATPEYKRQLDLTKYSEPDILKIVSKINGLGKEKVVGQKGAGTQTRFFMGAGINRSTVKSTGLNEMNEHYIWDERNGISRRTYTDREEVSYGPKFSIGLDFAPFPKTQQLILRSELAVATTSYTFLNTHNLTHPERDILYTFTLKQVIVSLAPQFIYNVYNTAGFKFYLGGGVAYNQCFYPENQLHIKPLSASGTEKEGVFDNYRPYVKHWINFPFRAGLILKNRLDLSFMAWSPTVLVNGNDLYTQSSSVQAGLSYLFNK